MPTLRLLILTALATTAVAAPAAAAPWHSYSIYNGKAPVAGGTGGRTHAARLTSIVLPDSWKVRKHATSLTFGPFAACRSTGAIAPKLVASTATTSAAVLGQLLAGGTTYGEGTRGGAAWRVAKFQSGVLQAFWVGKARLAQTWIVVQATTKPHGTCHIGGVRESLGIPLADAFGTIRASGY
jgi:hypothetical protein